MAGTGNLQVLRLCRYLRSRVGPSYSYILYGSHMAVSMAIGLLFLGGGRWVTTCDNVLLPVSFSRSGMAMRSLNTAVW